MESIVQQLQDKYVEFTGMDASSFWIALALTALAAVASIGFLYAQIFGRVRPLLDPTRFIELPVKEKRQLTHNTYLFRLAFPHEKQPFGLPIGQHVSFKLRDGDKDVMRSYTPTSTPDQLGYADFVIKIYPTGKMTQLLEKLQVGDKISIKGPRGRFAYQPNMKRAFGMIAGGTGITPMFQVMQAVFMDPRERTKVDLLFGNVTADDILIKEELEALQAQHPSRLSVYHVLNQPPTTWTQGAGFITADMIKARLPAPGSDVLIMLCGPPPMLVAMRKHLDALGYTDDMIFQF